MAFRASLDKASQFTDIQRQYIDILVDEYFLYWGRVPYGEKQQIAERLGCSTSYLTQLDHGKKPGWIEERNRRFRERIPIADPMAQLAFLQEMLDNALEKREEQSIPLTSKDPVDIIETARKITHGQAYLQVVEETKRPSQHTTFNFTGLTDEQLDAALTWMTRKLRDDDLAELGDIIDGTCRPASDGDLEGAESRAIPAQSSESPEPAQD